MNAESMTTIWDCDEYMRKHWPPYHEAWDAGRHCAVPVAFSFAYTPKGRVSRYWCSITLRGGDVPRRVREWADGGRPRLRRGYRWSRPYWYS